MTDPCDCIGPDLNPELREQAERFMGETPEQHTAKVLAEINRLLEDGTLGFVSVEYDSRGNLYADSVPYTTMGHRTFIGALSALIEAHRESQS